MESDRISNPATTFTGTSTYPPSGISVSHPANGVTHGTLDRAHRTVDRLASAVHDATDQLAARGVEWQAAQDRLTGQARDQVRAHPFTTVGLALAVGFLLSRVFR